MSEVGPAAGETHYYPPRGDEDLGGDFDQARPPRAGLAFSQRVALATAVVPTAALTAGERFHGNFVSGRFVRRIGDGVTHADQQVVRRCVQIETEQVGEVTMIAQPVGQ